jgi:hypothetical protein
LKKILRSAAQAAGAHGICRPPKAFVPCGVQSFAKDDPRWQSLVQTIDFYSTSGCRDMFSDVMEHWLTILAIKSFLDEQKQFRQQNPAADALTDLDEWEACEAANPRTFLNMYLFSICKKGAAAAAPAIAATHQT